ncbi:MAG: nucleoside-diphosphate kinase [Candidatus Hermodarchaeia archaeon]|jgi:nucleoside-diphosphate kinase
MEQTLLVLKPDATMRRGVSAAVLEQVLTALPDITIRGFIEMAVPRHLAEKHYAIHEGKFFYPWLVQFIQVGHVIATVLEGENIVTRLRDVLGATFVENASPESLRGKFGLVGGVNVAHASDEPANAKKEISLWQRETNLDLAQEGFEPINVYIARWKETPVMATYDIRQICQEYAQDYSNRELHQTQILDFLVEECPEWLHQDLQNLADAILGNMDLDRDKS